MLLRLTTPSSHTIIEDHWAQQVARMLLFGSLDIEKTRLEATLLVNCTPQKSAGAEIQLGGLTSETTPLEHRIQSPTFPSFVSGVDLLTIQLSLTDEVDEGLSARLIVHLRRTCFIFASSCVPWYIHPLRYCTHTAEQPRGPSSARDIDTIYDSMRRSSILCPSFLLASLPQNGGSTPAEDVQPRTDTVLNNGHCSDAAGSRGCSCKVHRLVCKC